MWPLFSVQLLVVPGLQGLFHTAPLFETFARAGTQNNNLAYMGAGFQHGFCCFFVLFFFPEKCSFSVGEPHSLSVSRLIHSGLWPEEHVS